MFRRLQAFVGPNLIGVDYGLVEILCKKKEIFKVNLAILVNVEKGVKIRIALVETEPFGKEEKVLEGDPIASAAEPTKYRIPLRIERHHWKSHGPPR